MSNSIYFKSMSINKTFNTATIIVTSQPMQSKTTSIAGINVGVRVQHQATFGLLSLIDPETGKSMTADSTMAKQLQTALNAGDPLDGFRMSENNVMDRETNEPTDMFWVEAI